MGRGHTESARFLRQWYKEIDRRTKNKPFWITTRKEGREYNILVFPPPLPRDLKKDDTLAKAKSIRLGVKGRGAEDIVKMPEAQVAILGGPTVFRALTPLENRILGNHFRGLTFEEVGARFDMTPDSIRGIITRAYAKVRLWKNSERI